MADDETQGPDVTSWWASDAFDDSSLPTATFDEPLVWPESPAWDGMEGAEAANPGFDALVGQAGDGADLPFPLPVPESDAQWRPSGESADPDATVMHAQPLAGLGGGAAPLRSEPSTGDELQWPAPVASRTADLHKGSGARSPELGSIWSNDFRSDPENLVGFAGLPAPAIYADTERNGGGRKWPPFDIRPGNAAVIGLISVVSLVLLGMFLSVRARNDTPTDASQARPAGDEISVTGPLNTVPLTTTVTSTSTTVPAINIAELLPSTETTGAAAATGGTGTGSGTSTATTAPPRAAAPTGGGTATTTATTQPAATPAPPVTTEVTSPPPVTSPPATSPPVEDTTPTTSRPRPTVTFPSIPNFPGGSFPTPTFTIPGSNN